MSCHDEPYQPAFTGGLVPPGKLGSIARNSALSRFAIENSVPAFSVQTPAHDLTRMVNFPLILIFAPPGRSKVGGVYVYCFNTTISGPRSHSQSVARPFSSRHRVLTGLKGARPGKKPKPPIQTRNAPSHLAM